MPSMLRLQLLAPTGYVDPDPDSTRDRTGRELREDASPIPYVDAPGTTSPRASLGTALGSAPTERRNWVGHDQPSELAGRLSLTLNPKPNPQNSQAG